MPGIKVSKRKAKNSKAMSDAVFCSLEGCYKPSKWDVLFLDHKWETMHVCDNHKKEFKELMEKIGYEF